MTEDVTMGWNGDSNGSPVSPGVYIYIFEVDGIDENGNAQRFRLVGDLTLIR